MISLRGPAVQHTPSHRQRFPVVRRPVFGFYASPIAGRPCPRRLPARHDPSGYAAPKVSSVPFPISVNYLSKGLLGLFPPPSEERRQDRTDIRIEISDALSDPPQIVSSHSWPSHDDCSAVYPDVERLGLQLTIVECFPGLFGVDVAP